MLIFDLKQIDQIIRAARFKIFIFCRLITIINPPTVHSAFFLYFGSYKTKIKLEFLTFLRYV